MRHVARWHGVEEVLGHGRKVHRLATAGMTAVSLLSRRRETAGGSASWRRALAHHLRTPGRALATAVREPSPERDNLRQAAKAAAAAVLAWLVAAWWVELPQPFLAPYAAVFLVDSTVYRSMKNAAQQVAVVALGVLLASVSVMVIQQHLVALGASVFIGLLLARWRVFGPSGSWIAITALLVIVQGGAGNAVTLLSRILEVGLGAAIGVAVNAVVFPPMHLHETRTSVRYLGVEITALLRKMAGALRDGWDTEDALDWLHRAQGLDALRQQAEDAVAFGQESLRLNPLRRSKRLPPPASEYAPSVSALGQVADQVKSVAETLVEASGQERDHPPGGWLSGPFAELLDRIADATEDFAYRLPLSPPRAGTRSSEALRRAEEYHEELSTSISSGILPRTPGWAVHGALLLSIERALIDLGGQRMTAQGSRSE